MSDLTPSTPNSKSSPQSESNNIEPSSPSVIAGVDDVIFKIRTRFNNPEYSCVPLESVSRDAEGLSKLITGGGWKAALKLATLLSTSAGLPHIRLRYRGIKLVAMMKLIVRNHGLLQLVLNEIAEIGNSNSPHNSFESYPNDYPNKHGSFYPFTIRLVECEALYLLNKDLGPFFLLHQECKLSASKIDPMSEPSIDYDLDSSINLEDQKDPTHFKSIFVDLDETKSSTWHRRSDEIAFSILTRQMQSKEYSLTLQTIQQLLPHYLEHPQMKALVIRLHVLGGNLKSAKYVLAHLETSEGTDSILYYNSKGFLLVAESQYTDALTLFQKVLYKYPYHLSAVHNAAICKTYLCDISGAIRLLEDALFTKPKENLNETTVFNLCSLYDMISERSVDRRRKVLELVLSNAQDHFNLQSLRLPAGALAPTNYPPIVP